MTRSQFGIRCFVALVSRPKIVIAVNRSLRRAADKIACAPNCFCPHKATMGRDKKMRRPVGSLVLRRPHSHSFQSTDVWQRRYVALRQWLHDHGGSYPSRTKVMSSQQRTLDAFVRRQRWMYFKNTLSRDKIRALERLPHWQWDLRSGKWETSFLALQRWLNEHDNSYPCYESQDQNEKLLATWVRNQRNVYYRLQNKSDVCTTLNADRRCRLEKLPDWDWRHQPWEAVFEELQTWLRRHSPNYPKRKSPNTQEARLTGWIYRQRAAYHNDCLSERELSS